MSVPFTHTGRRPVVGSTNYGRLYGHDIPKAGRVHALNVGGFMGFTGLCGEQVEAAKEFDYEGEFIPECRRSVQAGADKAKVTCKRCLKLIGN